MDAKPNQRLIEDENFIEELQKLLQSQIDLLLAMKFIVDNLNNQPINNTKKKQRKENINTNIS